MPIKSKILRNTKILVYFLYKIENILCLSVVKIIIFICIVVYYIGYIICAPEYQLLEFIKIFIIGTYTDSFLKKCG